MRIWWYLASQFLKCTISVLLFALSLYLILTYMEESQHYFDGYTASLKTVFFYYFWQIPAIIIQLLPFAVLIGGIITNWLLARQGEISALRAAGCSMLQIARPLLFTGFFLSCAQFGISELLVPETSSQYLYVKHIVVENKKQGHIFTQSKWLKAENSVLHYQNYDDKKQTLEKAEFFKFNPKQASTESVVQAQNATFDEKLKLWVLHNALVTHFDPLAKIAHTQILKTYLTNVDFAPPKVLTQNSESNQLSYWGLKQLIRDAELAGTNVSDRLVDLYFKVSSPFANLLFVFLTLPFALRKERQEDNYIGIIVCLAVALIYWFGNLSLRSLAAKGALNPMIAAWAMNVLVASVSFLLVRKLDKGL